MKLSKGGVCTPKGFMTASAQAGIKYKDRTDMALIFSKSPCQYAATFTLNVVKAAPVRWDMDVLHKGTPVHAVVINSGNANAATGAQGALTCLKSAEHAAEKLGVEYENVLLASTGVIGVQLPLKKICKGIDSLADSLSSSKASATKAAEAILTTDTYKKEVAISFMIGETKVSIGGMAKGSGMIHPNMGTMLSFITTDINISKKLLTQALSDVVEDTYNMVSVDGDTSTNDSCILLANGEAGNEVIVKKDENYDLFKEALLMVNKELAMMIAGDGEGATALVESVVTGAKKDEDARKLAKSVITSSLTKAAIFGHDANWGRIICALGYAGVNFDPDNVDISIEAGKKRIDLVKDGVALDYSEKEASSILSKDKVRIISDIKMGEKTATAWGCDLSYDYVKINADYRS